MSKTKERIRDSQLRYKQGLGQNFIYDDALLQALADEAVRRGQSVLNLGLGMDGGITFFKKKWGAFELMPHLETSWTL